MVRNGYGTNGLYTDLNDLRILCIYTVLDSTIDTKGVKLRHSSPPAGRGVEFAGCRPAEW